MHREGPRSCTEHLSEEAMDWREGSVLALAYAAPVIYFFRINFRFLEEKYYYKMIVNVKIMVNFLKFIY